MAHPLCVNSVVVVDVFCYYYCHHFISYCSIIIVRIAYNGCVLLQLLQRHRLMVFYVCVCVFVCDRYIFVSLNMNEIYMFLYVCAVAVAAATF